MTRKLQRIFGIWSWAIWCLLIMIVLVGEVGLAQIVPPNKGGTFSTLGLPPVYKGFLGGELQWYRSTDSSDPTILAIGGVFRNISSPIQGLTAIGLRGYFGIRSKALDGGVRAEISIPTFDFGVGIDYNIPDDDFNFMLRLDIPIRRSGIFGRGSTVSINWIPSRGQSIGVGVTVPMWGSKLGKTRPQNDNVQLKVLPNSVRLVLANPELKLSEAISDVQERAMWITRMSQPFVDQGGKTAVVMESDLSDLKKHIGSTDIRFPKGLSLNEEIRVYHESLDHAFSLAGSSHLYFGKEGDDFGRRLSAKARALLLDEVILPYNNLLGQRKKNDKLSGLIAVARTEFARWLLSQTDISILQARRVYWVFQSLCDIMEENRSELRKRWRDSRFVWLPLQFALKPEQHDKQSEINEIIQRATKQSFSADNRVWYVINEQFQWELARSVRLAEDYHVLWVHDIAGVNDNGKPDKIAFRHTLNYLEVLAERVEAYDQTGKLPAYFIFLDQHYFEINKARRWLRILQEPLTKTINLPSEYEEWSIQLKKAQDRLRMAVDSSTLLAIEKSQYGEKWLNDRIRVNVNITYPADPSFYSFHVVGVFPVTDNYMRDHRKLAFYDLTEEDPYRGMALFTGMGIGEHYVGTNWEDRAIIIQGPAALAIKEAGRKVLLTNGMTEDEIPFPLRPLPYSADYQSKIKAEHDKTTPSWIPNWGEVVQLHNGTGFQHKKATIGKAILYSLMPEGSVLTVPSSLWQSYIYASLLAGSSLRGCRVLIINPTNKSSPSSSTLTMARAHGLMSRLVEFSNIMHSELESIDGLLKVGLYNPQQGVADIAGRVKHVADPKAPWMNRLWPLSPEVLAVASNISALLDSIGYSVSYLGNDSSDIKPKLHLKANFMASSIAWEKICSHPGLADLFKRYIAYLAKQSTGGVSGDRTPDVQDVPEDLLEAWRQLVEDILEDTSPQDRERLIFFLTVGSINLDYRSMLLDGEVMILLGGWLSTIGFFDFIILPRLCTWIETTEELDQYITPPGAIKRKFADFIKLLL